MRLSSEHRRIVKVMESSGYVWLTHLTPNAQMRFRNKTRAGFDGYIKIKGLTFFTKRVANYLEKSTSAPGRKRLTYKEQVAFLEKELIALEKENYQLKGYILKNYEESFKEVVSGDTVHSLLQADR